MEFKEKKATVIVEVHSHSVYLVSSSSKKSKDCFVPVYQRRMQLS